MAVFVKENWQAIVNTIGAIVIFFLGWKTRKTTAKEVEFLAYKKKLETYEMEFEMKTEMLENLKKDYEDRFAFIESHLTKVKEINKKLRNIIEGQDKMLSKYEQKLKSFENA
ncbi:hypothetical protein [Tenacibaculum halocynthiae]|uniref:hypothetical protein n=1 Tax=Tenacibaculum halocynthiae TaxID=1254437 RepID=UPI00389424CA